jgi:hypothetical protein
LLGLSNQAPLKATGIKSGGFFLPFFFKNLKFLLKFGLTLPIHQPLNFS